MAIRTRYFAAGQVTSDEIPTGMVSLKFEGCQTNGATFVRGLDWPEQSARRELVKLFVLAVARDLFVFLRAVVARRQDRHLGTD